MKSILEDAYIFPFMVAHEFWFNFDNWSRVVFPREQLCYCDTIKHFWQGLSNEAPLMTPTYDVLKHRAKRSFYYVGKYRQFFY